MVCTSKATWVMRAALLIDRTLESYRGRGLPHLSDAPGIPWYRRAEDAVPLRGLGSDVGA